MSFFEPLEPRQLLSVTWVNHGGADNFDTMYGRANAKVARKIVRAAMADWNKALPKNVNLKVRISAAILGAGTLGRTSGTTIQLDHDGGGKHWFFDPDLTVNPELPTRTGPFQLRGTDGRGAQHPLSSEDFYSAVLHEIGHALGFNDSTRTGAKGDPRHAASRTDLMNAKLPVATRRFVSFYDVQHTAAWAAVAARATQFTASATTGAPGLAVGWSDAYPGHAYVVYRSTTPGADHKRAGATRIAGTKPGVTSFVDASAVDGVTYHYYVAPVEPATAAREARASGSRAADAAAMTLTATTTEPRVRLTWTPVAGARYYAIYVSGPGLGKSSAPAAVVRAPLTTWTDPASSADGAFSYRVKAVFDPAGLGAGVSFPGPVIGASYASTDPSSSSADLSVAVGKTGLPELTWAPKKGFTNYRVYRAVDTGTTNRVAAGAALLASGLTPDDNLYQQNAQFVDVTAPVGVPVRYWVTAVDPKTNAELTVVPSTVFTRTSDPAQSGTVHLVQNGSLPGQYVTFDWDPVPDASFYTVYVMQPNASTPYQQAYHFNVTTTSTPWGFPGRVRVVVTATVNGQETFLGSAIGWQPSSSDTPAVSPAGITIDPNWTNPSPDYTLVFRTTSPNPLDFATDVTFLKQVNGGVHAFTDDTAVPGTAYYYWTTSYYSDNGGDWLVRGFAAAMRP
jgi:hypothetical protein